MRIKGPRNYMVTVLGLCVKWPYVNPLLPKGAFQGAWKFPTTIDVKGNSTNYHQTYLLTNHLYVKTNSIMRIWEEEETLCCNTLFEKIQRLSSQVGAASEN